ncbi:creatinase-like [Patiria miniata]|uniref:Creatinase n=1 Tax=Patiria miniata TaxID=46514 RepID=A0A914BLI2_PATMI|nr:creatinase-like [Patiria miniata]
MYGNIASRVGSFGLRVSRATGVFARRASCIPSRAPGAGYAARHAYTRRWSSSSAVENMPSLMKFSNGEKVKPTFSKAEMEGRLRKLRTYMDENSIGGALFTSYHCINYYSDFLYLSFGRPYGLVVTPEKVVIISALIDYGQPDRRNHLGETVIYTDWQRGNYWRAVEQELGHIKGKVGCELDHIPEENHRKLQDAIPGAQLVDIAEPSMYMRLIKSPEEIALIREGARVGDIGGEAGRAALAHGVPEYEVALASTGAMVREIAKTFPHHEIRDTWSWISGGVNTDGAHNAVTTRPFQSGDIVSLNCFPMIAGYYTALERTLFIDHATDENLRLWEINCEVHRRGMELIKPGVKCQDIARELNEIFQKHDLLQYRTFGYGHSFGTLCHYYGREAALEFREDIDTVLEPNMVVSMEPMITIPEGQPGAGGYREHNILVLHEDGAENITHFPFGPEHHIVKN